MDSINRLNRMMEILRRQIADSAQHLESPHKASSSTKLARSKPAAQAPVEELRRRVTERLRTVDPGDPKREQKARRVFLESVLAWEFGDSLLQDRRIDDLLDNIQETLSASADVSRQLDELLAQLNNARL